MHFPIFSSIRLSKYQKLSGAAYRKLKVIRECEKKKSAASLLVFPQKEFVAKAKCKDEDAECTVEWWRGGIWRKCEYDGDKYRNKSWRGISCRN